MDISFFLRHVHADTARFGPDRPALSFDDQEPVTYRELGGRTNSCARALVDLGVRHGDRVGILMYNSVEYWVAYFAITRLGAIAVRLNFRLTPDELEYALNDSGATVVLADAELLAPLHVLRDRVPVREWVGRDGEGTTPQWASPWTVLEGRDPGELDVPLPAADDGAMIMYTSGTTGRPKGVLWSHGTTTWWAALQIIEWRYDADSVMMVTGPLYHIGGVENYIMPTLAVGGHGVMVRSKAFELRRTLEIASAKRVTDLLLFPVMINQLVDDPSLDDIDMSCLRRVFTGGDALVPSVCEKLRARLPGADLIQLYGLTEGTPMAACSPPGGGYGRPDTVGRAYPFVEISVRDDAGAELPPGEVGEIWTRSPANSLGYWNKPEETARTFTDGWCHTGDLGIVRDGALSIAGRKKDMIRSGGENISPVEIEDVLVQHPAVRDAAVIGIPDPVYVEAVCAVVVASAPVTESELVEHCRARLAGYKKPRRVVFLDELPRTPSQKVQKFRLREMVAEGEHPVR